MRVLKCLNYLCTPIIIHILSYYFPKHYCNVIPFQRTINKLRCNIELVNIYRIWNNVFICWQIAFFVLWRPIYIHFFMRMIRIHAITFFQLLQRLIFFVIRVLCFIFIIYNVLFSLLDWDTWFLIIHQKIPNEVCWKLQ